MIRPHAFLLSRLLVSMAFVLVSACGAEKAKPDAAVPLAPAPAESASAPAGEAHAVDESPQLVKVVEGAPPGNDDRYSLAIEPPTEAKAGESAQVMVRVIPQAPWHINLDFPTSLTIEAPQGVDVPKSDLKKADAVKLDEDTAEFAVAFTSTSPGEKAFTGKFKFAVCQDEACAPVTEDVEFKVAIK